MEENADFLPPPICINSVNSNDNINISTPSSFNSSDNINVSTPSSFSSSSSSSLCSSSFSSSFSPLSFAGSMHEEEDDESCDKIANFTNTKQLLCVHFFQTFSPHNKNIPIFINPHIIILRIYAEIANIKIRFVSSKFPYTKSLNYLPSAFYNHKLLSFLQILSVFRCAKNIDEKIIKEQINEYPAERKNEDLNEGEKEKNEKKKEEKSNEFCKLQEIMDVEFLTFSSLCMNKIARIINYTLWVYSPCYYEYTRSLYVNSMANIFYAYIYCHNTRKEKIAAFAGTNVYDILLELIDVLSLFYERLKKNEFLLECTERNMLKNNKKNGNINNKYDNINKNSNEDCNLFYGKNNISSLDVFVYGCFAILLNIPPQFTPWGKNFLHEKIILLDFDSSRRTDEHLKEEEKGGEEEKEEEEEEEEINKKKEEENGEEEKKEEKEEINKMKKIEENGEEEEEEEINNKKEQEEEKMDINKNKNDEEKEKNKNIKKKNNLTKEITRRQKEEERKLKNLKKKVEKKLNIYLNYMNSYVKKMDICVQKVWQINKTKEKICLFSSNDEKEEEEKEEEKKKKKN